MFTHDKAADAQPSTKSPALSGLQLLILDAVSAVLAPVMGARTQHQQATTLAVALGSSLKQIAANHR